MIARLHRRPRLSLLWGTILLLFAASPRASAAEIQPDRLNFGTVHVGARVEGSVRIFVAPKDAEGKKAQVDAPAFVRILKVNVGTQDFGGNTKGFCDVDVSILTAQAGEESAPIRVTVGGQRVEVPVRASIRPRVAGATRVLVAETPFEKFSTSDGSLFDTWRKLVDSADLDVDYLEIAGSSVLEGVDLAKFDVVLLGTSGVFHLKDGDVAALRQFAERGGRVIMTANHFFMGTVAKANRILIPYGLRMKDEESHERQKFDIGPESIAPCPFTEGVKALFFHRPSPTEVLDVNQTFVLVEGPPEVGGCLLAYAKAGEGEVLGLGESLWWNWLPKADNAILFGNLLKKHPRAK
jgi:hypothetical protein